MTSQGRWRVDAKSMGHEERALLRSGKAAGEEKIKGR